MPKFSIVKTGSTLPALIARKGDFEDWVLAGLRLAPDHVLIADVCAGAPLPDYDQVSGVVITGSHSMVTEHLDWSERTAEWLAGAVAHNTPILGICYGHQLLAYALGGQVGPNPAGREYGTTSIHPNADAAGDPLLAGLPDPFWAHVGHVQSVLRLPRGATLLARSAMDPHQAFRVGDRAWGVQFHPEFDADTVREYLRHERQALAREGQDPDKLRQATRETPAAAELLARFARLALS